jgi:hypothetical protein
VSRGDIDPRFTDVQLGIDIEAFLNGTVGKYLASRVNEEVDAALCLLATVDPDDAKKIRELQNQHWRASSFKDWLVEAMAAAKYAESELTTVE